MRKGDTDLPPKIARLVRSTLGDRQIGKFIDYIAELDRELAMVNKADPAWRSSSLGGRVIEDLTLQRSVATNETGNLAKRRMERLIKELTDFIGQAAKIDIETLSAKKGILEASIKNEQVIGATAGKALEVTIDDEHQYWPFKGEYWKDELGYYRFRIISMCTR
jgi:hypothetical protein